jgi:DNA primase
MYNVLELLRSFGIEPRKVSTGKHGEEHHSACPVCGDGSPRDASTGPSDRFIVWPTRSEGGYFSCRRCGIYGDNIQFVRDTEGKSFPEACAALGIALQGTARPAKSTPRPPQNSTTKFQPHTYDRPGDQWLAKAQEFVLACHEQLIGSDSALQWLAKRGITRESAIKYKLGYNPGNNGGALYKSREAWGLPTERNEKTDKNKPLWLPVGLVIPMLDADGQVVQLRIRRNDSDRKEFLPALKYYVVAGGCQATMVLNPEAQCFAVVEAGLDAILVAQEAAGLDTGAVTVWNASAKPDAATVKLLKKSMKILVSLDDDAAGHKQAPWWLENFRQAKRLTPTGGKDPGEMFENGGNIREWLLSGLPPAITMFAADNAEEGAAGAPASHSGDHDPAFLVLDESGGGADLAGCEVAEVKSSRDIEVLQGLMQRYHIMIRKNDGGINIENQGNCPAADGKRLCDLVWLSDDVADLIERHPSRSITASNIMGAM